MEKQEILTAFYSAFKAGDHKKMNSSYSKKVVFNDAIFKDLNHKQVTKMWSSLLSNSKESQFEINYEVITKDNDTFVIWTLQLTCLDLSAEKLLM